MKFTVSKDKLLESLQTVQNVVGPRITLPILSNVHIFASNGLISFTTNDLDIGVAYSIEGVVEEPGGTTLPVRRLCNIVKELPSADVSLHTAAKDVTSIRCGQSLFKMNGISEEEFPQLPKIPENKTFTITQKQMKEALRKTSYAVSSDETRYVLTGILFSFKENKLTLVATDGRRLALADIEVEFPRSSEVDIIVPSKCVNELIRLLGEDADLKIKIADTHICFEFNGRKVVSKLIDGNYPNYRQVIPAETKEHVTIERELLQSVIRRVALLSSEKTNSVKLNFTKNNLEITSNTPEVGEANESMAIQYSGKDLTIAFNPTFMLDPIRCLTSDEIYIDLIDEMSPGLIKDNTPFLYVIMPMRLT